MTKDSPLFLIRIIEGERDCLWFFPFYASDGAVECDAAVGISSYTK
jgi:hypothetical protein